MLLLAPRYGSGSVKSAFQDSSAQPSASDQKCRSIVAAAAARAESAPGIPAATALDVARESAPTAPSRCARANTWVMRALTYSGQGCVTSISPLAPSQPKPPSANAAAHPNVISRLASARRHSAVPGSVIVFLPGQGHAGRGDNSPDPLGISRTGRTVLRRSGASGSSM